MGFGWLLMGYFFANVMPLYSPLSFAKLVGYPMIIFALYQLAHYHDRFRYCWYVSFVTLPFAVYFSLYGLTELGIGTGWWFLGGTFLTVVQWAYFVVSLVLHVMLLWGIIGLCAELKLIGIQSNAYRNLIMVGLYYVIYLVSCLPVAFIQNHAGLFALPLILLRVFFLVLNMMLIFNCHRYICPEGDEDMPDSSSAKKGKKGTSKKEEQDGA